MSAQICGVRPYQTWRSSNSNHAQIQTLDQRIQQVIQKLRSEENRLFWNRDAAVIEELKSRADILVLQRDKLADELQKVNTRFVNVVSYGGIGAGTIGTVAWWASLTTGWGIVATIVGGSLGMVFADLCTEHCDDKE